MNQLACSRFPPYYVCWTSEETTGISGT
jgi:hypothetical protein